MHGKTLVIQNLQGIGDTMWFVRHFQAIAQKTPSKTISVLTRPRSMADQILQYDPNIDQVLWLDIKGGQHDGFFGTVRLAQLIRAHGFESVWILHSRSLRYAVACRLAGVKHIYGPGIGVQKFLLTENPMLEGSEQTEHPILRGTRLLEKQGLKLSDKKGPLCLGSLEKKWAQDIVKDFPKPWVGLGVASSETHKKWSWESYVELAKSIHKKSRGSFFIMGGPMETKEAESIFRALKEEGIASFASTGQTISESLALLSELDLIVSNDTGILHAAPMVGTKGLVLLGKTQVPIHHYAPVEGLHLSEDEKPQGNSNDLSQLSSKRVMEKLLDLEWVL